MLHFTGLKDIDDIHALITEAIELKKNPYAHAHLGLHKTLGLLFLNPSLRTRLSSQIAAQQLGLTPTVIDASNGWNLELNYDTVMNEDKAEHIIEAAGVIGSYFDILGFRSFPSLSNKEADDGEELLEKVKKHAQCPIISLESATGHPLQSLADMITIHEYAQRPRPKVVLTWAPHPRALPQAVPNTFSQFAMAAGHELTICHPPGAELNPTFTTGAHITHDQQEALQDADFVYVKNWSSYHNYGEPIMGYDDWQITAAKLMATNNAKVMHCLPVRRNVVIAQEVLDSPQSIVIPQAQNRIFSAQVVLKQILETYNPYSHG